MIRATFVCFHCNVCDHDEIVIATQEFLKAWFSDEGRHTTCSCGAEDSLLIFKALQPAQAEWLIQQASRPH